MTNTITKITYDGEDYKVGGNDYTAGTGISISASNEISNSGVTSVNGSTGAVTVQPTLVSGTNIKTINNNSILGSGDLTVSGLPSGGTTGQILVMTANGPAWANPTDANIVITDTTAPIPIRKLWGGEASDYSSLQSFDEHEAYWTVPDSNNNS